MTDNAADLIARALWMAGLTAAQLASRLDMPQSLLDQHLDGQVQPTLRQLEHILAVAGLEPDIELRPLGTRQGQKLLQVLAVTELLPHGEPGPLLFPPFRTFLRRADDEVASRRDDQEVVDVFRAAQRDWPEHLRDDAPVQACSGCGRKTWTSTRFGRPCAMTQPDGTRCPGVFVSA
jgi:transcriptional regulator with XRE-family HTH domain